MTRQFSVHAVVDGLTSLLTAGAAVAVLWTVTSSGTASKPAPTSPTRSNVTPIEGLEIAAGASARVHAGAKLAIIEFSDFECPYCGRYARDIYPQVQRELVDKGIVNYSFRHFPLESIHKTALKAGEASACAAEQGKFWEMHDRLFQNQKQLGEKDLLGHARALGLDESKFKTCLGDEMVARIREDQAEARKFGVNSTPTFLVGLVEPNGKVKVVRKLSGAQPYEIFKSVVDDVLKGA